MEADQRWRPSGWEAPTRQIGALRVFTGRAHFPSTFGLTPARLIRALEMSRRTPRPIPKQVNTMLGQSPHLKLDVASPACNRFRDCDHAIAVLDTDGGQQPTVGDLLDGRRTSMATDDWADENTVVYANDRTHGLLVQRGDLLAAEIEEAKTVASLETLGDARRLSADQPWIARWLEMAEPDLDLTFDLAESIEDTVVGPSLRESYAEGALPVPWEATRRQWLPHQVRELSAAGGASPAGHIDAITFPDADEALEALQEAGYRLVEDEKALRMTLDFPNFGD